MLEDEFGDVIAKARRGLGLDVAGVAARTGIPPRDLERAEACALQPGEDEVRRLAEILALQPDALVELACGAWEPDPPDPGGPWRIRCLTLASASGFTSNTYLLWHEGENDCVVVDPGFEPDRIAREIEACGLTVRLVAVTHGHHDHVGEAGAIARRWDAPALLGAEDLAIVPAGARTKAFRTVSGGECLPFGRHELTVIAAPGHTSGGRAYEVDGAVFVGDTLFAASIGRTFGGPPDYPIHLETVGRLLEFPAATRLCPGHGPQTTVGQEREHNPFARDPEEASRAARRE